MSWTLSSDELPEQLLRDLSGRPADPEPAPETGSRITRAPRADGDTWLADLPRAVGTALERWQLERDHGAPLRAGYTALVVPVRRPRGDAGALKVGWPHVEADTEHLALRSWQGSGAVALLAADPASATLLLERLDAERDLSTGSVLDTTEALGQLVARLDRPAPPWAATLSTALRRIQERLAAFQADPDTARALPRRMVQQAGALVRDLLGEGAEVLDARLVHSDLHQLNVLWRPDPGEWVAIDPKPMAADPHWAVAPALWNRWADVLAAHDARTHLQLRLGILCDAAGLDEDRARAMTIVRLVDNAVWAALERSGGAPHEDVRTGSAPHEDARTGSAPGWTDRAVTIVKAMQPG